MRAAQLKGSFTIEASLIIPIVFFVMVTAISSGIKLCQECIGRDFVGYEENWESVEVFYVLQALGEGVEGIDEK